MRNAGTLLRTSGVLSSYRNHGQWCPESAFWQHAYGTETVTLLLDPDGTLEMAFRHI